MNWKLIFLLSLLGLTLGFASVSLVPSNIEPFCWLFIFIVSSIAIAKKTPGKYFLHGFFVMFASSIWLTAVHLIFYNTYVRHHPEFIQLFEGGQVNVDPRLFMALSGPIFGLFFGIVLGLFAWIAGKIFKKR